ncbi:MAG: ArgE/DapE family deacylase [Candidatus Aminicenantes bacterium]|nr:ArgE/DapE family deacylase [Candidatus Aminicenantes bacterium]
MTISIDRDYLVETLKKLVRINSINPELVPDGPGEVQIAEYISEELKRCGLEPRIHNLKPKRCNVVAVLKGSGQGRSLMFNGHMDTVGVEGMVAPFAPEIRDGKLFGRGAQDMKGSLAAMITAFKALTDSRIPLRGDLIFAAVADEEHGSIGTEAVARTYKTDAAVVTEPSDLDIGLAHRGFSVFEIETQGFATHGSLYQEGIDANMHMGSVLSALDRYAKGLLQGKTHSLTGPASLHVPLIKGGTGLFIYSDKCRITVERRTLPGESHDCVKAELESILEKISKQEPAFKASLNELMHREGYEISADADIVKILSDCASEILGRKPSHTGHQWWEDSALLAEAGMATVIIGPKGQGAHSHEEWVDIQSVIDSAAIYAETAARFCG